MEFGARAFNRCASDMASDTTNAFGRYPVHCAKLMQLGSSDGGDDRFRTVLDGADPPVEPFQRSRLN